MEKAIRDATIQAIRDFMPNLPHPDEPELTIDESLIEGGYEVVVFPGFFSCIMPANKSGCQILFYRNLRCLITADTAPATPAYPSSPGAISDHAFHPVFLF
jgi:hypothetical protein